MVVIRQGTLLPDILTDGITYHRTQRDGQRYTCLYLSLYHDYTVLKIKVIELQTCNVTASEPGVIGNCADGLVPE